MKKEVPQIIKEVGFDFWWDNKKVWKLDYPIEEMEMKDLSWHFEIPFWNAEDGYYNLSPNELLKYPPKHIEEHERTMNSDLLYPIDIMQNKGRWLILDGLHRLVKASILNYKKVKVRKIPRSEIPNIRK